MKKKLDKAERDLLRQKISWGYIHTHTAVPENFYNENLPKPLEQSVRMAADPTTTERSSTSCQEKEKLTDCAKEFWNAFNKVYTNVIGVHPDLPFGWGGLKMTPRGHFKTRIESDMRHPEYIEDTEFYTKALDRGDEYYKAKNWYDFKLCLPDTFSIDCVKTSDLRDLVRLECTCGFYGPVKTRCSACRVWSWVINPVFMRMQYEEVENE